MHKLVMTLVETLKAARPYFRPEDYYDYYTFCDLKNFDKLINIYEILDDEQSKIAFSKVVFMRLAAALIPHDIVKEKFSPFSKEDWDLLCEKAKVTPGVDDDYILDRIDTWVLKGYEYGDCRAISGDVVIDGGAFTGNTALYFSQCVGHNGRVYSFEPGPEVFSTLKKNTQKLGNVFPVEAGIGSKDGFAYITGNSCGALVTDSGRIKINIRSLDSFVREMKINKVDFIKFDIEGSEEEGLDGARETIQQFSPKMAICIYHKPQDMFSIAEKIISINNNYQFYIKHNSNWLWETVLFCMPSKEGKNFSNISESYRIEIALIKEFSETISLFLTSHLTGAGMSNKLLFRDILQRSLFWPVINVIYQALLRFRRALASQGK